MNRNGQTLVLFVLLLPLLFIFAISILEIGLLLVDKNKVDNEVKYAIKYGLNNENIDAIKIREILNNNLGNDIEVEIKLATSDIHIIVKKEHNFLFLKKGYKIDSRYRGYKSDNGINIEKE